MTEDAELLMSLYDGILHKPFTENYVVHWSKDGLASDIDQLHNLKVLFTVRISWKFQYDDLFSMYLLIYFL